MAKTEHHLLAQLSWADKITLLAIACIVLAFSLLLNGHIEWAIGLAFVSMFFDYMDGMIARKFGGSPYGKVLDSLYDIMGWVLFPAAVVNMYAHWAWWAIVISTLFCVFSAIRLSRFTVDGYVESDKRYYVGVPVLFSKYALLVAPLWQWAAALILAIMVPLMVSKRLIKKPHPFLAQINLIYAAVFAFAALNHG